MRKESINKYDLSESLNNIIKLWLIAVLLIVPYQNEIMNHLQPLSLKLSTGIRLIDEITIIICFPLAFHKIYRARIQYQALFLILIALIMFSISALLSGMINDNSLFVTGYGIFYYVKYFILIFIYAAFFREYSNFKKIFRYLLIVAVIVGFVAFVQEVWVLIYSYVFNQDTTNDLINVVNNVVLTVTHDNMKSWRMGIYRTSSLMSHYNLLGFYSLLILTVYLYSEKKLNLFFFFCLLSGILFSMSRVALIGFIILCILQCMKGRKWLILLVIVPIYIAVNSFVSTSEFDILGKQENNDVKAYRLYARQKAMEVWKDYPLLGVGPGKFGGVVAIKTNSQYYEEYNFASHLKDSYSDLDQFWPQAFAETGAIGTGIFASVYVSILVVLLLLSKRVISVEIRDYLVGLALITVFIFINTFASSLNIVSILYPYCALSGMGLGITLNELSLNCKDSSENSIN